VRISPFYGKPLPQATMKAARAELVEWDNDMEALVARGAKPPRGNHEDFTFVADFVVDMSSSVDTYLTHRQDLVAALATGAQSLREAATAVEQLELTGQPYPASFADLADPIIAAAYEAVKTDGWPRYSDSVRR
jgi:hypothetical protein